MIGQSLAHYKILEKIGSGGMGDVYLALDSKLDRKVALKVLPPELAEREERRARFEREAKAIAALNHPNIVTVYSVEEADGVHFITMELVKGQTLAQLLPRQGFALDAFFDIAVPLADAVAAAHEQGIVHRDLKPGNVMVTDDGRIKVLDFGLAKPTGGFTGTDVDSNLPTAAKTEQGVIVGTFSYMSPEQARGKTVDARSDIFSLGIVFYEMLTGRRPFAGDTATDVLSSIMKDVPPAVSETRSGTPRELSRIVRRCLSKDPSRRFQSTLDMRNELDELRRELDSGELPADAPPAQTPRSRWSAALTLVRWLVPGVFALAAVVLLLRGRDTAVMRLENPFQLTSAVGVEDFPTWSPDGSTLAYHSKQTTNWDIWVIPARGGQPLNRTADHDGDDQFPSWSPDGRHIAFWSSRDGGGIFVMDALAGAPRKVTGSEPLGPPHWLFSGQRLGYCVRGDAGYFIETVSLVGGAVERSPIATRVGCLSATWSPDQRWVSFLDSQAFTTTAQQLILMGLEDETRFELTDRVTNVRAPTWSRDGRSLYFVSNRAGGMDLWRQPLTSRGTPAGSAVPITAGIGLRSAAFSPNEERVAYSRGRVVSHVWRVSRREDGRAIWADAEQLTFDQSYIEMVDISPDRTRLIVSSDRAGNEDLWILPLGEGEMQQLTRDPAPDWDPAWSPDGRSVLFYSLRSGNRDIWMTGVLGGEAQRLTNTEGEEYQPRWSPDGESVLFWSADWEVFVVPSEGGAVTNLTNHPSHDAHATWSPNGKQITFVSDRGGDGNRLWRMASDGSDLIQLANVASLRSNRWSPDGKFVYFFSGNDFSTTGGFGRDIWVVSSEGGSARPVTELRGKRGSLGTNGMAVDEEWIYFTWEEDLGDIWVMNVVTDEE